MEESVNYKIGKRIIKNAGFNIAGRILPLAIGFVSLPFIISGLGVEQFGLLSIIWAALLNYFSFFDLGLGQGVTKFVSRHLGEEKILSYFIWTSLFFALILGIIGAIIVFIFTPILINNIFKVSGDLAEATRAGFFIIGFAVPFVILTSACRGTLEGFLRYDIINYIKIPVSSLIFLIPVFSIMFGFGFPAIIIFLVAGQAAIFLVYLFFCAKIAKLFRYFSWPKVKEGLELFAFGKWLVLSNLLLTFLTNLNRFLLGAIVSVSAIGFYSAPLDTVSRMLIFPESFSVLFPLFSNLEKEQGEKIRFFYIRSLKHFLVIMGLITIIIIFFSADILFYWLGPDFKQNSTVVLQLLTIGIFSLSFSLLGENVIKGFGRTDILGKLRLGEVILFAAFFWLFVRNFGLNGAAFVWMFWAIVDALAINLIAFKLISLKSLDIDLVKTLFILFILGLVILAGNFIMRGLYFVVFVLMMILVFIAVWRYYILDDKDISFFKSILRRNG